MTTREQRDKNTVLNKKHTQILNQLIAIPENKTCSDCSEVGRPSWASWNIGVFLCIQCSGIHRRMGVHISKVRSISLDKWDPKWIKSMEKGGNKKANEEWEYHLPSTFKKLPSSSPAIEHFIRDKYEKEIWKRSSPPPSNPEAIIAKYLSMTSAPSDGMSEMSYMSQSTSSYQGSSYDGGSSSRSSSKAGGSSMQGFGSNGQAYKNSSNDDALANAMSSLSAGWSSFASSAAEMAAVAAERAKELGEKINDDVIAPTRETLADPELMAKLQKKVKKITSTSSSSRRGGGGSGGGGDDDFFSAMGLDATAANASMANKDSFFSGLQAKNNARPADLPPSQGGKYAGFGSNSGGGSGGGGNYSKEELDKSAANKGSFFASLQAKNNARPTDLPPSQGGKYAGFGSNSGGGGSRTTSSTRDQTASRSSSKAKAKSNDDDWGATWGDDDDAAPTTSTSLSRKTPKPKAKVKKAASASKSKSGTKVDGWDNEGWGDDW